MGIVPDASVTMLHALLIVALAATAAAQTTGFGRCSRKVTVKQDFDVERYMGSWYEVGRIPNTFQRGFNCSMATYRLLDDGKWEVDNSGYTSDGEAYGLIGEAKQAKKKEPAKMKVRFSKWQMWAPYWVVDTDYDSYTLVWSCISMGMSRLEYAWIMSRDKTLDPDTLAQIHETGNKMGIAMKKVKKSDQNCE